MAKPTIEHYGIQSKNNVSNLHQLIKMLKHDYDYSFLPLFDYQSKGKKSTNC